MIFRESHSQRLEHRSSADRRGLSGGTWGGFSLGVVVALSALGGCDRQEEQSPSASATQATVPTPKPAVPASGNNQASDSTLAPPKPSGPPLSFVESLVAPVALYPDPLLSELLIAATYPVEIVQAARWLEANPDLAALKDKDWDPSVQRIAQVPEVLTMMNEHLDWTTALGNAFLENPDAVLAAVQTLRGKAVASGFLTDTPQQKVERRTVKVSVPSGETSSHPGAGADALEARPAVLKQDVVTIRPAKGDTVYVPQYSPEVAYSAPLAPPPGAATTPYPTTTGYPAAAPAYYPSYKPSTTATESSTSPWLTFGAGALVGGLVTWGVMELADDDDWDDGYWGGGYYRGPVRVVHHYGDAVCYRGNCWNGGGYRGNGYRGGVNIDRGDINLNRQVNVSGNRVSGDRTFKLDDLRRGEQVWRHDPEHRRGQRYSEKAKERIAERRQPDRAGSRLSGLDGQRDGDRGFGDRKPGDGTGRPATLPAKRPLSSNEVRARLSDSKGHDSLANARNKSGVKKGEGGPAGSGVKLGDRDRKGVSNRAEMRKEGAFSGATERGSQVRQEAQRGKASRQVARGESPIKERVAASGAGSATKPLEERGPKRGQTLAARRDTMQRSAQRPNGQQRAVSGHGATRQQSFEQIRRPEHVRPSAFAGARDGGRARDFSHRGAASRQNIQAHRTARPAAGSGGFQRGGGGHGRGGGGGRGRGG